MKIIVPLRTSSVADLTQLLSHITPKVNMVEIWLDGIIQELLMNPNKIQTLKLQLEQTAQANQIKYLGVCKMPEEQGQFMGNKLQRAKVLNQFLQLGGDLIDLDVSQNEASIITQLPSQKLCLSYHHFASADIDILNAQHQTMQIFKPALYKFAVTPQSETELETFLNWAKNFTEPAIFTTMGDWGSKGREQVKPYTYGAFYALDQAHTTASGQPTLAEL